MTVAADRLIKVQDMPSDIQDACRQRGFGGEHEMTALEAVREWSAWHLGDGSWADTMIYFYRQMVESR